MAHVRRERVDGPLLVVERHRVPASVVEPEVAVERGLEVGRLLAVALRRLLVAHLNSEVVAREVRAVDVALHLAQGDRRLGQIAVGKAHRVPRVLPALVGEAAVGRPLVLDVAVAVTVAELLDPLDRPIGVRQEAVDQLAGEAPPAKLAEEHDEQRRGVGGAVVDRAAAQRQRRRLTEAHLVQDPPRLLLGAVVDLRALEAGERLEHAEGEVGVGDERHPCREDRVAAKERHEPRRAGRDDGAFGEVRVEYPQCTEVLGAAGDDVAEHQVVGLDERHLPPPLLQALGGRGPLDGAAAPVPRLDLLVVDARRNLDAHRPLATRRHDDLERHHVAGNAPVLARRHPNAPADRALAAAERDLPVDRL